MYVFIITILIAELIIASTLISFIMKLDKKVCECSLALNKTQNEIKSAIAEFQKIVANFVSGTESLISYIKMKREQYTIVVIKNILIFALLFILRGRSKKLVSAIQLVATLKDYWDKNIVLL